MILSILLSILSGPSVSPGQVHPLALEVEAAWVPPGHSGAVVATPAGDDARAF